MHCILLLPDAAGRLPTVQELRQRGFAVSTAVELPGPSLSAEQPPAAQERTGGAVLALASEDCSAYGGPRMPGH